MTQLNLKLAEPDETRLAVEIARDESVYAELAKDVRDGLQRSPKSIPTKYLYDARGSELFDAICDLPEYYPTRTEQALLESVADEIVDRARPTDVVELGSGAARKTRVLLDAFVNSGQNPRYVPMDVSESMLRAAALGLLEDYPDLEIHGLVGDYHRDLDHLPKGDRRMLVIRGSTIGNFPAHETDTFLRGVRDELVPGEYLLLGADLVKPTPVLEAAYNDAAGVTAEFNRNVLNVLNRELEADFDVAAYEHVARFNADESQMELALRSEREQKVSIRALDLDVDMRAGELLHTEISRKFTRERIDADLVSSGFELDAWYTPRNGYFGLALARAT